MENINTFIIARTLHIIGVVLWIGGVAFVTTVLIPCLRKLRDDEKRLDLFEKLEGRFAFQARIVTIITGATGFYMLNYLQAWQRYLDPQYWWIHMMTFIWIIFSLVLFVLEPLFLHRKFHDLASRNPIKAFRIMHALHIILLTLSLITIFGAVAGVRGFHYF